MLEWSAEDNGSVLFYEVVVEEVKKHKGGNQFIERVRLKVAGDKAQVKMDPLLPVGDYRYKVTSYNLFRLKASESDWKEFSIVEAKQPAVKSVSLDGGGNTVYIHEDDNAGKSCTLHITGKNLFDTTRYELFGADGGDAVPLVVTQTDGKRAKATVDTALLNEGTYRLFATDSSGLKSMETNAVITVEVIKSSKDAVIAALPPVIDTEDTSSVPPSENTEDAAPPVQSDNNTKEDIAAAKTDEGPETVHSDKEEEDMAKEHHDTKGEEGGKDNAPPMRRKSNIDYCISAGYSCPIFIHDDTDVLDIVQPDSFNFRISALSPKPSVSLGAEVSFLYSRVYCADNKRGDMAAGNLLFVCQKPIFHQKAALEARAGGGVMYLNNIPRDTSCGYFFEFDAGVSFQYRILKHFFAELADDFALSFMPEGVVLFTYPSVGAGVRF